MKSPDHWIIPHGIIKEAAKNAGSIDELINLAKKALERNVLDQNHVFSIPDAAIFLEEARRRFEQLTDEEERKKYALLIAEAKAMLDEKMTAVMHRPGKP